MAKDNLVYSNAMDPYKKINKKTTRQQRASISYILSFRALKSVILLLNLHRFGCTIRKEIPATLETIHLIYIFVTFGQMSWNKGFYRYEVTNESFYE